MIQHREGSQYFIITINGIQPLKVENHYVVNMKHNTVYQLYLKKIKFKKKFQKSYMYHN